MHISIGELLSHKGQVRRGVIFMHPATLDPRKGTVNIYRLSYEETLYALQRRAKKMFKGYRIMVSRDNDGREFVNVCVTGPNGLSSAWECGWVIE